MKCKLFYRERSTDKIQQSALSPRKISGQEFRKKGEVSQIFLRGPVASFMRGSAPDPAKTFREIAVFF